MQYLCENKEYVKNMLTAVTGVLVIVYYWNN